MDDLHYSLKCGSKLSHSHSSPKDPVGRLNIAMPITNNKILITFEIQSPTSSFHYTFVLDQAVHNVNPLKTLFSR